MKQCGRFKAASGLRAGVEGGFGGRFFGDPSASLLGLKNFGQHSCLRPCRPQTKARAEDLRELLGHCLLNNVQNDSEGVFLKKSMFENRRRSFISKR